LNYPLNFCFSVDAVSAGAGASPRGSLPADARPPWLLAGRRLNRLFASTEKQRWQTSSPLRRDSGLASSARNHARSPSRKSWALWFEERPGAGGAPPREGDQLSRGEREVEVPNISAVTEYSLRLGRVCFCRRGHQRQVPVSAPTAEVSQGFPSLKSGAFEESAKYLI
jgi:hypothetical protein